MEPFVDFGLFEMAIALGLASAARAVYSRRWATIVAVGCSVIAPAVLIFAVREEWLRWVAALGLASCLINAAFVGLLLRHHEPSMLMGRPPLRNTDAPATPGA